MSAALTPLDRLRAHLPSGYRTRTAELGRDAMSISALINACSNEIGYPLMTSEEDMKDEFTGEGVDLLADIVVIEDVSTENSSPSVIAWGMAWRNSNSTPGVFVFGNVHPHHQRRGVGRAVLSWSLDRAEQLLGDHPNGEVFVHLPDVDQPARRLLESHGATPIRFYADMQLRFEDRHTTDDVEGVVVPDGYNVVPATELDSELLRQLRNHCFADHWGSWDMTPEGWRDMLSEGSMRLQSSEVALNRDGEPVALQLTSEFPQDASTVGHVRWIGHLGVHRAHRRRGLAAMLIERHLRAAKRDGYEGSMLGVDTESLTDANTLYEKIGYRRRGGSVRYRIPRDPRRIPNRS